LAIARSIVKQPKILILDEATSAIDVRGERIVQAALDKVSKNRTTITIAHRLSTIMKADNIVVLKKGQVVQQGTHEDLLKDEGGAYWALANAQQLSFGNDHFTGSVTEDREKQAIQSPKRERFEAKSEKEDKLGNAMLPESFHGSFGLFLWEQKLRWKWYTLMLFGALCAGGDCIASLSDLAPH
jgi:ATP-binding cassette subfamily B (MDR/TAP) protein 1